MRDSMNTPEGRSIPAVMLGCLLLAGCGSTTEIERPSTYVGDITPAHLEDVYLAMPGDKRLDPKGSVRTT